MTLASKASKPSKTRHAGVMVLAGVVVAAALLVIPAPTAQAADFPVSDATELEAALTAAVSGDRIVIDPGITITLANHMPVIDEDIEIVGNNATIDANDFYDVFETDGASLGISDLTIHDTFGDAIRVDGGGLTIDNVNIRYALDSGVTVTNVPPSAEIRINELHTQLSSERGIDLDLLGGASASITNSSVDQEAEEGIAIVASDDAMVTVRDTQVVNTGRGFAASLTGNAQLLVENLPVTDTGLCAGVTLVLTDSTSAELNRVSSKRACGTGIKGQLDGSSSVVIADSTFAENSDSGADFDLEDDSRLEMRRSTFSGNEAGGIVLSGGGGTTTALLVNSTVSGNLASPPPGVAAKPAIQASGIADFSLLNSTVTNNTSDLPAVSITDVSLFALANTVIGGNATTSDLALSDVVAATVNYSLVQSPDASATGPLDTGLRNILGADPHLDPLADNGGPTLTHTPKFGSPLIAAGEPNFTELAIDQRGEPRVTGDALDIGAVELAKEVPDPVPSPDPVVPERTIVNTGGPTVSAFAWFSLLLLGSAGAILAISRRHNARR